MREYDKAIDDFRSLPPQSFWCARHEGPQKLDDAADESVVEQND